MTDAVPLWRPAEHEELIEASWDPGAAAAQVTAIVADAERAAVDALWPVHPLDGHPDEAPVRTLYFGSAGMIWALMRLGWSWDAGGMLGSLIDAYRDAPDFAPRAHRPSLWMGEAGLLAVAARVGSSAADPARLTELIRENRTHRTWELMWGSPGTMLAAQACGLDDAYRDSAAVLWDRRDRDTGLWTQTLRGRPAEVLGPAHGFVGVAHALRRFVPDEVLRAHVASVLERTAMHRDGLVNWPPSATPEANRFVDIRVQWCHGAPGVVATVGDLMPLELAERAGELVWRAGPLVKGPGLCHGTAGNGFALLRLFALTGDERWLDRARRFAMHAIAQVRRARAELGRGRFTLFTGDVGVALYLRACASGDPAFPTVDDL